MHKIPDSTDPWSTIILDIIRDALMVLDESMRITFVNQSFTRIFRISKEASEGVPISNVANEIFKKEELLHYLEKVKQYIPAPDALRIQFTTELNGNGSIMIFKARHIIDTKNNKDMLCVVIEDHTEEERLFTELTKTRQKLTDQNNLFEQILKNIPVGIALHEGTEFILSIVNEKYYNFSQGKGIIKGRRLVDVWPEAADQLLPLLRHVSQTGETFTTTDMEFTLNRKGGPEKAWFSFSYFPYFDHQSRIAGVLTWALETSKYVKNTIEVEQSRDIVRKEQELLQTILDSIPVMIVLHDPQTSSVRVNKTFTRISGYTQFDAESKNIHELLFPDPEYRKTAISSIETAVNNFNDFVITTKSNFRIESSWASNNLPDGRLVHIGIDISERKQTETALKLSEERFRTLAENISQLVWMTNDKGVIIWYNKRWFEFTGTTDEIMRNRGWETIIHPDYLSEAKGTFLSAIQKGTSWDYTFPMRRFDGTYRWFLSRAMPIRDTAGNIVMWFGTNTDISDMRKIQMELSNSAERFRLITSSNIIGVAIGKNDGELFNVNDYFLNLIGYSRAEFELNTISWKEITPPEYLHLDFEALHTLEISGTAPPYEKQYIRKDGTKVWVLLATMLLPGSEKNIFAFVQNITAHRQALEEAQKLRAETDAVLNSLPDGYLVYNTDGVITRSNERSRAIFNITNNLQEISVEHLLTTLTIEYPDEGILTLELTPFYKALHGVTLHDSVVKIVKPRQIFWFSVSASPIKTDGHIEGAILLLSDITRLHLLQEQLTGERNFVNAILQTSGALIVVFDKDMNIVRFNKTCEELTGFSSEEIQSKSIFELFIPDDEYQGVAQAINRLYSGESMAVHENHWKTKSGDKRFIRWHNTVITDKNKGILFIIATGIDITDHKHLEEQLERNSQQLSEVNKSLESFSYSVSHDLRGPLSTIGGFAKILFEDYKAVLAAEGQDYLRRIIDNTNISQQLIGDILNLSRIDRGEIHREWIDLSAMVRKILESFNSLEPQRKVEFFIQNNVSAFADTSMVRIELENLIRNAWKFTSKNLITHIEFGQFNLDGKTAYYLSDNGIGFDKKFSTVIFEPFKQIHSEKEFKGSGIGLSIVKRVVVRHNGKVWAEAEPLKGATFYFTLN